MKLEKNELGFLFSTIELPDIFFSEYLSQASGDFIKVYLYLIFLSKYNKEIKINDLSKKLNLSIKTIQDSLTFWENSGIITKKTNGYLINSIQEIELYNLYSPKLCSSPETVEKNLKNQYRSKAIENINNHCFQGMMSPSWYNDIDFWFNKYGFDEQVMIALFNYCLERSALHRNYVQTVAENWSKNEIKNFTDLDNYYQKQEKLTLIKKSISKKLGLSRNLTQYENAYIEKWIIDYNYNLDIIEIALKKTASKSNPNFVYIDKIISDWFDRKLNTTTDIQNFLANMKKKNTEIKNLIVDKNHSYNNYEQRDYSDLDSFYINNA